MSAVFDKLSKTIKVNIESVSQDMIQEFNQHILVMNTERDELSKASWNPTIWVIDLAKSVKDVDFGTKMSAAKKCISILNGKAVTLTQNEMNALDNGRSKDILIKYGIDMTLFSDASKLQQSAKLYMNDNIVTSSLPSSTSTTSTTSTTTTITTSSTQPEKNNTKYEII